jgi:mono/diheme cytochrome c family protein
MSNKKLLGLVLLAVIVLFGLVQLVPYGRNHDSPPVQQEPVWDSPSTRTLAVGACFDCHSSETEWAWYSNVAPASWLIQRDVDEGRDRLNFSEWGTSRQEEREIGEVVREGEMPPLQYRVMHASARLSAQEKDALINGLAASLGQR